MLFQTQWKKNGNYAFHYCSALVSITIPNSVSSIGDYAFAGCFGLTSVEIPISVAEIGDNPFRICENLESFSGKFASDDHRYLIVDNTLKAFAPAGLTAYSIPNSVTSIGNDAFYGCTRLISVEIPNSVSMIGTMAFSNCSGLTEIISLNTTPPSAGFSCFINIPTSTFVLRVPKQSVDLYKAANQWKNFFNIVAIEDEDGVERVKAECATDRRAYTVGGRVVQKGQRGLIIENGKKVLRY